VLPITNGRGFRTSQKSKDEDKCKVEALTRARVKKAHKWLGSDTQEWQGLRNKLSQKTRVEVPAFTKGTRHLGTLLDHVCPSQMLVCRHFVFAP
jgi:hypothetical protein